MREAAETWPRNDSLAAVVLRGVRLDTRARLPCDLRRGALQAGVLCIRYSIIGAGVLLSNFYTYYRIYICIKDLY